jgi:hypothetical protein
MSFGTGDLSSGLLHHDNKDAFFRIQRDGGEIETILSIEDCDPDLAVKIVSAMHIVWREGKNQHNEALIQYLSKMEK